MTLAEWIHPNNAVKTAQFILNLDKAMIEEAYLPELEAAIYWLKDSLDYYLHPHPEQRFNGLSMIENLDYATKTLLEAVRNVLPCLTDEAKAQLRQFLLAAAPLQEVA